MPKVKGYVCERVPRPNSRTHFIDLPNVDKIVFYSLVAAQIRKIGRIIIKMSISTILSDFKPKDTSRDLLLFYDNA